MPPKSVDPLQFLSAARLTVVAGKGGVGKTTVTAVLARAAVRRGLRTLVVELDGKPALHTLVGDVASQTITAGDALAEYLDTHGLKRVSKRLISSGVIDVVATAAPGIDDIVVLGKVKQLERSGDWDLILVDGPAAGHAITFLLRRPGHARHGARRADPRPGPGGRGDARRPGAQPGGARHAARRRRRSTSWSRRPTRWRTRSACTSARSWSTPSTSARRWTRRRRPAGSAMRAAAEFRNARRAPAARRVRPPARRAGPAPAAPAAPIAGTALDADGDRAAGRPASTSPSARPMT